VIWRLAGSDPRPDPPQGPPGGARRFSQTEDMSEQEQAEIRLEFARLKQEHMDFDAAINAMIAMGCDALQIQRMKKKKLALKDRMKNLEDRIIPDIIA
jgi:hypothetical protein